MTRSKAILAALATLVVAGELTGTGPLLLGGDDAHAVVGRPLTPVSYAGVARRTTRRAAYSAPAAAPAPSTVVVAQSSVVTTLPGGCTQAGTIYDCGGARYQPYYQGSTLVYRPL